MVTFTIPFKCDLKKLVLSGSLVALYLHFSVSNRGAASQTSLERDDAVWRALFRKAQLGLIEPEM